MIRTDILRPRVPGVSLVLTGLVLTLLYVAGCDTLSEPGTLALTYEKTFRFEFTGSQLTAGQAVDIVSANQIDLTPDLQTDGFTTGEVVSAEVTAVELERIQPLSVNLSFLDSAMLLLQAGSQTTQVAAQSTFSGGTQADLSVSSGGGDVASFVRRPAFRAVLRLTPDQVSAGEAYRLEATVRFRVNVEGV